MTNLKKLFRRGNERGQGMTEYIIIVGLVAILLVGAVRAFKQQLEATYNRSTQAIDTNITQQIQ